MKKILAFVIITLISCNCFAEVRLPAVFCDNMVLQQRSNVPVWGWAQPGEKVTVKGSWEWFWGRSVIADQDGRWKTSLKTPAAGGPFSVEIKGENAVELKNVLIGEVWLCSGQSNMDMPMEGWPSQPVLGGPEEIANADYSQIRLFQVKKVTSDVPLDDCQGSWQECSPESVKKFSAVAYYFGKKLYSELNVPIGLIQSAWGGTPAEAWTKNEVLQSDDDLRRLVDKIHADIAQYKTEAEKAKQKGDELKMPWKLRVCNRPSMLYNAMLKPLIPYRIKGVIWYQGETNAGRAYQYRKLFPAMIDNWRDDWQQGDFPFYYVQLASFIKHTPSSPFIAEKGEPVDERWCELREAQLMTLDMAKTGMAVAIDIGEAHSIHPRRKKEVGDRLAFWALAKDYGYDIEYSGPLYKSMSVEGNRIRIRFDHADSGLLAKSGNVEGFAIAGQDKKFVWADAVIDGNSVVVSSSDVDSPVAVRYGWSKFSYCNLYNKEMLPASPFRTDDWKGITADKVF